MENFISVLSEMTNGLLYYSESENPYTIEQWNITKDKIEEKIATENNAVISQLRKITPDDFFQEIERTADLNDAPIAENAKSSGALFVYLKKYLSDLSVIRVETGVCVPIYLTGGLNDGLQIVLKTVSIES